MKALQYTDISLMDKINFLAMLGDTNKVLKEYVEAKKCYNQAFMESMQMEQGNDKSDDSNEDQAEIGRFRFDKIKVM